MKVIVLTQYYPPDIGAAPARLSELAARFIARGHEVCVLTAMPSYPGGRIYPGYGGLFRRENQDGVSVLRSYIYPTKSVGMARRFANYFSFVASSLCVGVLARLKGHWLIVENPPLFLGLSGYLLSRLTGMPLIFNVSDLWPDSAVHLGIVREGWSLRLARALESFCYRKAWLVTGQSREIVEHIRRRFSHLPTYHLSNGVDPTLFSPERRCARVRRELAGTKACIALYAGLHGLAQGLEQVVQAAALLQDLEDFGIVFMGDGPQKECLMARARALGLPNVRFLGPYPRAAMPAVLASVDIALVPLKNRLPGAVPSKLYEAMGAGVPVVLAAEGEAAAIVRETDCGVVVPPDDVDALAAALRDLVAHEDKRRRLGAHGRQAALARFNRQRIVDRFIDFLEAHAAQPS